MCIYKNYRSIYIHHYGPIPIDEEGRSYEIHHKDGNRNNNHPTNLIALSIEDHYALHKVQNDYAACLLIASRISVTAKEKSKLASLHAYSRVENGSHPWKTDDYKKKQRERALSETNPFRGGEIQRKSHKKRLEEGNHHLLGSSVNKLMIAEGRHCSQKTWTCEHCGKSGRNSTNYKRYHGLKCKSL